MPAATPPRVLFVTYGGGHAAMVIPVVKRLIAEGLAEPVVVALTTAAPACRRAGVDHIGFKDLVPGGHEDVWSVGRELLVGQSTHPAIEEDESVAYHGLSFLDLVDERGAAAARDRYDRVGRDAFRPVATMRRAITDLAPDLVVATNSPRAERAALEAAGQLGVPTCCLIDVFGVRSHWLAQPGFVDRICVMSDGVRDLFVRRGQRPEVFAVTGNPSFDVLADVITQRDARTRHPEFRVLWAPHPEPEVSPVDPARRGDPELNSRIGHALVELAERHADWMIELRPHPSQPDLFFEGPRNFRRAADEDIEARLVWADVVVTCASTVGLQASLVGAPAVAVSGSVVEEYVPLADMGLAHRADIGNLDATLDELRRKPVAMTSGLPKPGDATRRVVEELLSLT